MIIPDQRVSIRINNLNKPHYESLGYDCTEYRKQITVPLNDLSLNSIERVWFTCDWDGCENKFTLIYKAYNFQRKNKNIKDLCPDCRLQNIDIKSLESTFLERDMKLVDGQVYKNAHAHLQYVCLKHPEKGILKISTHAFKMGRGCKHCRADGMRGQKNWQWRGGVSSLEAYLRDKIYIWRKDSMIASGFKCVISAQSFNDVHHLYGFNFIFNETLLELEFPLLNNISDYSQKDLNLLTEKCIEVHYRYPLGVCLTRDIHKLFHNLYGTGNNTPEQFNEFKNRWELGELTLSDKSA